MSLSGRLNIHRLYFNDIRNADQYGHIDITLTDLGMVSNNIIISATLLYNSYMAQTTENVYPIITITSDLKSMIIAGFAPNSSGVYIGFSLLYA